MSTLADDQTSQASSVEAEEGKSAEDYQAKTNGLSEESAGSDPGAGGEPAKPKENGISSSKSSSSSHKHGDGHRSSDKDKHKSSSSSSKHGSSSSSSSKHKDGSSSSSKHSSSSSSKHRDGSSSKHSSSSSSKSKEGGSSSSSHRDKDGKSSSSSSSKPKDGSSSSSSKHHSSSSSSSSKHRDGSSSKHRDGKEGSSSSSSKDKHSSSSSSDKDKHRDKDKHKSSSSSSSDKHKSSSSSSGDKLKSSSSSSGDKHKSSSSSSGDKHKSSSSSDKHKSSSSSSSDKHKSSSSSSDKHKSDKHKSSSSSKDESRKSEVKAEVIEEKETYKESVEINDEVKEEPLSPVKKSSPVKRESESPVKMETSAVKSEDDSEEEDEDKPLSVRISESRPLKRPKKEESDYEDEQDDDDDDDDDDTPLLARAQQAKKQKIEKKSPAPKAAVKKEIKKEVKREPVKKATPAAKRRAKEDSNVNASPTKKKKDEQEPEVWRWWEEQSEDSEVKWKFLEHKGPIFAPLYEPLPKNVRFYYDGKPMELSEPTEEVATFYGRMLDHDYTTKEVFNKNFFKDWKSVMTKEEMAKITDLKKCNFTEMNDHFKKVSEEKKNRSKEEKQNLKKENEELTAEYGFCVIDHHTEKIGNFKIEPPGLFRGRGDHPKQGMLKRRVMPSDVIINCSKDSVIPKPPQGHKWKEVRHDNKVTWLASWTENIQGATKYVMLNAASKLKGQKDWQKYETARKLHQCVDKIRAKYQEDWKSKEMRVRQRAVALYFIDKLALRAGNEKDDESADTVGCCSLRVEHVKLHEEKDGKHNVVEFDFLGKDSIRYLNSIPVEKRAFKNLKLFVENKAPDDDLFDRLNTTILNKHLQDLMEGLTAKVFRTYNASRTLSEQLQLLTDPDEVPAAKMLSYNRANRAVAILCNHQRAVPKTFEKSMENLQKKIDSKNDDIKQVKKDIKTIKSDYKQQKSVKTKTLYEKKKKTLARLEEQLQKLEVQATDRDENKDIALGTSKLNYLDPRISVAWCKKFDVPIEKVYNKTQRDKFRWAIDMATEHFVF